MDAARRQFDALIRDSGLVLIRATRHRVWRAPDGRKFICGADHGTVDIRTHRNRLASLRRFLRSTSNSNGGTNVKR
jgi:hypothetical protein